MDAFLMLKELLAKKNIDTVGAIRLSDCRIIRADKIKNAGLDLNSPLFVYVFAVPYYTETTRTPNISRYAVPRDYHFFFKSLFNDVIPKLSSAFPEYSFAGFTDNSPIDEREAAAKAGLGLKGKNGLLITEKYSSYVFLGEIITDMPSEECRCLEIQDCISCGRCTALCPKHEIGECLSSLTQKKGALSDTEALAIKKYGSAWGCDICQAVCPHTALAIKNKTIYTPIDFFKEDLTAVLSREEIENMTDEEFACRAYSWRKKQTILRNLDILAK